MAKRHDTPYSAKSAPIFSFTYSLNPIFLSAPLGKRNIIYSSYTVLLE